MSNNGMVSRVENDRVLVLVRVFYAPRDLVFKMFKEPEKIIYTDYFSDAEDNTNETMPSTDITMEFIDLGDKTKLISYAEYASAEALKTVMDMGMLEGATETWDRLKELMNAVI
ncbi:SRPBCC family protein [Paenibacillus agricola]|uniref:SRPBCC domain-containing protein n=1 Tax=Paenibacillus agricola TaxID=2716264 RepID=A0ABX0J562_9BACL|nr:SRPBCC domain-containing protein [Paenibacillus agricola]NHN31460.1 SRPBCC domain-containing protein [Paenibacillus agricola]